MAEKANDGLSVYERIILDIFEKYYQPGIDYFTFKKDEIDDACKIRDVKIRNTPDIIYTFRSRRQLPEAITSKGHWAIESAGQNSYAFRLLTNPPHFDLNFGLFSPVDIYNALPEVVEGLLRKDEQSTLTRVLYNRLIDIFTGLTCFHIQNHYRSAVTGLGEVELDAIYVGIDKKGALTIIPIEAKSEGDNEMLGRIQVSQMAKLVAQDFPGTQRRILAVKTLPDKTIGMVELSNHLEPDDFGIVSVTRYRLIRRQNASTEQLLLTDQLK